MISLLGYHQSFVVANCRFSHGHPKGLQLTAESLPKAGVFF
jgi:hypothetical protein